MYGCRHGRNSSRRLGSAGRRQRSLCGRNREYMLSSHLGRHLARHGWNHAERDVRVRVRRTKMQKSNAVGCCCCCISSRMAVKQSFLFSASCLHLRLACVCALMTWSCLLSRPCLVSLVSLVLPVLSCQSCLASLVSLVCGGLQQCVMQSAFGGP
jgi:hypothetical protein